VRAGAEIARDLPGWDWRELTFRAVAARAEVGERTVYRHFASEQELHRAVMERLEVEAGVVYEGIGLEDVADVMARVFASRLRFSAQPVEGASTGAFADEDHRRRDALLAAVAERAPDLSPAEREVAAGMLDVIWGISTLERLTTSWGLDVGGASGAAGWVIDLIVEALSSGRRPPAGR
jgi:AcrR family transcriptional regulator